MLFGLFTRSGQSSGLRDLLYQTCLYGLVKAYRWAKTQGSHLPAYCTFQVGEPACFASFCLHSFSIGLELTSESEWLVSKLEGIPPTSGVTGVCHHTCLLFTGSGGWTSSSHTCKANTSLTELSPEAMILLSALACLEVLYRPG